jgi:hypothetical protein
MARYTSSLEITALATAAQTNFPITFNYSDYGDIRVYVDGVENTQWAVSGTDIVLIDAMVGGESVVVTRDSDLSEDRRGSGSIGVMRWTTQSFFRLLRGVQEILVQIGVLPYTAYLQRDGSLPMTGDLDMGGNTIENSTLAHPIIETESVPTPTDGRIYVDSTTGKLRAREKGQWADVINFTEQGTGLLTGGILSVGTPTTTFSITDGSGYVLDHTTVPTTPTNTPVSWTGLTNLTATYLLTDIITFVGIDAAGSVIQQPTAFTNAQRRDIIVLGVIVHVNRTVVNTVNQEQHAAINVVAQLHDLAAAIGFINTTGNLFSIGGSGGLYIQKSAGDMFAIGSNWANSAKNPNTLTVAAEDDIGFQYRTQTGVNRLGGAAAELVIDPDIYDNAGAFAAVGVNKWTVQRIYLFLSGAVKLLPDQSFYNSQSLAHGSIAAGTFVTEPSILANGLLRGFLVVQQGETDLNNAEFIEAEKFGSASGAAATTGTEFADSTFKVYDDGDPTKIVKLQASGLTTGTTRTLTPPDASGTISLTSDVIPITNGGTGAITQGAAQTALDVDPAGTINYVHPNHSGDVVSAADGAQTIQAGVVTLAKQADVVGPVIMGRVVGTGSQTAMSTEVALATALSGRAANEVICMSTTAGIGLHVAIPTDGFIGRSGSGSIVGVTIVDGGIIYRTIGGSLNTSTLVDATKDSKVGRCFTVAVAENGTLSVTGGTGASGYQFSVGNGENGPTMGFVAPFKFECYSLSMTTHAANTSTVALRANATTTLTSITAAAAANQTTGLTAGGNAGDVLNFQVTTASGTRTGAHVLVAYCVEVA